MQLHIAFLYIYDSLYKLAMQLPLAPPSLLQCLWVIGRSIM